MAIGLDLDTEYANRTGIPNGGAGTLTAGGFADFFVGVWLYRPSATATYALTAGGAIIHGQAGAREVFIGFNNAGAALADLRLYAQFNSGVGGADFTFSGHAGNSFLDEWVYYFWYENAANEAVAGYIRHADLTTAVTGSRANDNAGSQYINTLTFGNTSGNTAVVLGHYAYARARDSAASAADVLTYANSSATIAGDWGFWPLANNTDTGDTSGNARPLTFGGTLTTETSPVFGTAPVIDTHPVSQTVADGATATFTATSAGATSFQWQSNQTGAFANISGATSSSYTTPATTQAYQGRQFRMVATNATGSATSGAASLGVTGFPVYLWSTAVQSGNDVWLRDPTLAAAGGAHATSGALTGQAATVAGTAAHLTLHATSGALSGQAATIAGTAAHEHAAVGALSAQAATISGTAAHLTLHTTSGALAGQAATISGTAAHQHATTGALAADSATIAGTADHTTAGASHSTSGALTADAATISGASTHLTLHTTSGALTAQAATVSGAAAHQHATTGALTGQAATVSGTAAHLTLHTSSGALTGQAAAISGAAADQFATTGALVAQAATISGTAVHASAGSHPTSGALAAGNAQISGSASVLHVAVDATPGWGTYPFRRNKKARQLAEAPEVDVETVKASLDARRALRAAEQRDQAITAQLRDIYAEQDALAMGIAAAQQDLAQQLQDDDDLSMILALAS